MLVAIHERRESVQKFWKRTTKRPIREDGTHDALFASKSPRETKTKASLAWKARICDASSPFPTVAFGVARARARARLRKSKKTTKADLVVARQKRHFKPHFSKAHLFHILVAVVTLHVRLFFALRVRVVIVVRERDVVVRTGLVSSFFSSSSSFRTHSSFFFCALRSAVVVSLSQVRPFSSSFRSLFFFGQFQGLRNQFVSFAGQFLRLLWLKKSREKESF